MSNTPKKKSTDNRKSIGKRNRQERKSTFESTLSEFFKSNSSFKIPLDVLTSVFDSGSKSSFKRLNRALSNLSEKGVISRNEKGHYLYLGGPVKKEVISDISLGRTIRRKVQSVESDLIGKLSINQYGTGFIQSDKFDEDIKVAKQHLGTALPGDIVRFVIDERRRASRIHGKIVEVVQRPQNTFVGTLVKEGPFSYYIVPDDRQFQTHCYVDDKKLMGAEPGQKVAFEVDEWTHKKALPKVRIVEVLGDPDKHTTQMKAILYSNQVKSEFTEDVMKYVDAIPTEVPHSEIERRLDLRNHDIFTIDPVNAKDFDDALSIERLENGNYYMGVHIADVTHYLPQDSILDEAALYRATSTYLIDRVIPMLPEKLSNGVCSLNPDETTLTFSCFMEVNNKGDVVNYEIRESVIHSKARFAYEDAQDILDGKVRHPFEEKLNMLLKLSKILINKRFREGSIRFETPEPKFVLDSEGHPIDVKVKARFDAHKLIEECMLLANKTVALHIENLRERSGKKKSRENYPFLYRIHDKPDLSKIENLQEIVKPLGIDFELDGSNMTSKQINHLVDQVEGTNYEHIVNSLLLRSMAKAVYSPQNIGHFGLSFKHYAHFTSPIRRYPDVIVHRILKAYSQGLKPYDFKTLETLGLHCSEKEKNAQVAERESTKLKQVEYLSDRIGELFEGIVSGVTEFGIYVELKENYCEGMVHVSNLKDDYYQYHPDRHCIVGKHSGKKYQLGDSVTVKVHSTNIQQKIVDFMISNTPSNTSK